MVNFHFSYRQVATGEQLPEVKELKAGEWSGKTTTVFIISLVTQLNVIKLVKRCWGYSKYHHFLNLFMFKEKVYLVRSTTTFRNGFVKVHV